MTKRKTFNFLLAFLTFNFLFLTSSEAFAAEQTLRVSPVIINVSLSPGKTTKHEVTIENLTNTPLPLRATLNDFIASGEEGGYIFEDTKTNPLLSWIRLTESEFLLSPKEKKTIQMTITTPNSIPLGGYYGILFFEPVVQNTGPAATRVNSKIGVLMLANVGVQDPNSQKAEILTFTTGLFNQDGNLPLLLRVKNISLNFFTAKPILKLTPLLSFDQANSTREVTLEDKIIFPGQVRRWTEEPVAQDLSPNIYKTHMTVSTGNGQFVATEKYVIVFPFLKVLGILALFFLIIVIGLKRKQIKKAIQELIK